MSQKREYKTIFLRLSSTLICYVGIAIAAYAFLRLGQGPFPFGSKRILKMGLGIFMAAAGWLAQSPDRTVSVVHWFGSIKRMRQSFVSWMQWLVLPSGKEGAYPPSIHIALTITIFVGLCMIFASLTKPPGFEAGFWHRSGVLKLGGLALASVSRALRSATRTTTRNHDWLKSREVLSLISLAVLVIAADIYFSQKIGLLAYPPYYDGVGYMLEAKRAFLHLGMWNQHPIHLANTMIGNRYPLWQALMVINFQLFGIGEWQSYAVRFWPTLIIVVTVFWVVRRRIGPYAGLAAALFTAFLPTLSLLRTAALGHQTNYAGYLADLRPDLLFAAFVTLAVVLMIEHAQAFDEWTALLSGTSAAFAVLTKSAAISAVVLAWGVAIAYVLFINRRDFRKTLQTMLWGLLAFTILIMPWLLAGGLEITVAYVRDVLTTQLPLYSNAHPTFRSEITYYWPLLIDHMGIETVGFAVISSLFLFMPITKREFGKPVVHQQCVYLLIAAALYCLVSVSLAKNYFLGLPSYLVLWIYCWASFRSLKSKVAWSLLPLAVIIVSVAGIMGARNIRSWKGHEIEEGRQDRGVMQQIALDLRQVLSNNQSFMSMPAYGNPAALLFYMPDRQGELPQALIVNGITAPPVQGFIQQTIEPAKAVLIYGDGNKESSFKGWAPAVDFPYYRAIAAWVQRPGSSHHLMKTYYLYREAGSEQAAVQLYVRSDQDQTTAEQGSGNNRR